MARRSARFALWVSVAALAWAAGSLPAGALSREAGSQMSAQVLAGPSAKSYGYLTPVVVIAKGGSITYTNLDLDRHNVVQDVKIDGVHGSSRRPWCRQFPRRRCPIFYDRLIGFEGSEAVRGLRYVKPGMIYTFYCTLHPGMQGKLYVEP